MSRLQAIRDKLNGGLKQLFHTGLSAAGGAFIAVYLVNPSAKAILTNLVIALGASVFGYVAGAQLPEEAE